MAGVQGVVELELNIMSDGHVGTVRRVSGNGLLAGPASEALKSWLFSPCVDSTDSCRLLMELHFVLKGGPLDLTDCKTKFTFNRPGLIVVESQFAKAILD
jgi:hypothetical protein